ncbi:TetR family transcriptional regulator [Cupriavidus necator]
MGRAKAGPDKNESTPGPLVRARLVPTQQRSRERLERVLACAAEVMAEKGSDAFRMSDIVERTGISFGSLYQYFPDKTAVIGTLAERYNAVGHECVRRDLATIKEITDLHATLCRITDSYYQMFLDEPLMRDIWQATQADRVLQKLDQEDSALLAGFLMDALRSIAPDVSNAALSAFSQLTMILIAAAVRHAITLQPREGRRLLTLFKRTLSKDLSMLET